MLVLMLFGLSIINFVTDFNPLANSTQASISQEIVQLKQQLYAIGVLI